MILYAEVPNFYAALELARQPELHSQPLIVGGDPRKRGRVQAASDEALRAGVRVGMSMQEALVLCADALPLKTDMPYYREVSARLRGSIRAEFGALEADRLESGYLDISHANTPADALGSRMIEHVAQVLSLPLRVGISRIKFLARLAAEEARDGSVLCISPPDELDFLGGLGVDRLPGVGPKTRETLLRLGATTIAELRRIERPRLEAALGNHGLRILAEARGQEDAVVRGQGHPQSLSREHTFAASQLDLAELWECLQRLSGLLGASLQEQGLAGTRVAVKVRFDDAQQATRSHTARAPIASAAAIYDLAVTLLDRTAAGTRGVRLIGVSVSALGPRGRDRQLELFS